MTEDSSTRGVLLAYLLATLLVLPFIVFFGKDRVQASPRPVQIGEMFPSLQAVTTGGDTIAVTELGRVNLVNIWATWCRPCVEELPSMEALVREVGHHRLRVVAISVDQPVVAKNLDMKLDEYARQHGLALTMVRQMGDVQRVLGTTGVPETYVVDGAGVVRRKVIGAADWASDANIRFVEDLASRFIQELELDAVGAPAGDME